MKYVFILVLLLMLPVVSAGVVYSPSENVDVWIDKGKGKNPSYLKLGFGDSIVAWNFSVNGQDVGNLMPFFNKIRKSKSSTIWSFDKTFPSVDITITTDKGEFVEEFDMELGYYVIWNYENDYVDFYDLFVKNPGITYKTSESTVWFYNVSNLDPIFFSDSIITIDDSPGEYDSWGDTCAREPNIYDDPDVPSSAFRYVQTSDANATWVLNETKIQLEPGAYMCLDYSSIVADYGDSYPTLKQKGNLRINNSAIFAETKGIPTTAKKLLRTFAGSTTLISDSSFHANRQGNLMALDVQYGTSIQINRTTISGFAKGVTTSTDDVIIDGLTISDCYEVTSSYAIHNMISPSVPWTDILIRGCEVGYQTHYYNSKAYRLLIEDCGNVSAGKFCWDDAGGTTAERTHDLIDSKLNWSSVEIIGENNIKREGYSFNLRVSESGTSDYLSGVNVTLYNKDGSVAFSELTDANGEVTEQEVIFRKWIYTGSNPVSVNETYYSFSLVLTNSSYQMANLSFNYSIIEGRELEGIDLEIPMLSPASPETSTVTKYITVFSTQNTTTNITDVSIETEEPEDELFYGLDEKMVRQSLVVMTFLMVFVCGLYYQGRKK